MLESPPTSGLYFYDPDGLVSEKLFLAMMKDVLEISPKTKHEGLQEFASRGFLLVDATYRPVNHLSLGARNKIILEDFPLLVEDLGRHTDPETGIVLAKVNVCRLLEPKLAACGFDVLNHGTEVPFPSNSHEGEFRDLVRPLLGL